jgi:hypothetical protein
MKANEMGDGEKPRKKEGNAESIHDQQVKDYENRERMLVLGRTTVTAQHIYVHIMLVFTLVSFSVYSYFLHPCFFPHLLPGPRANDRRWNYRSCRRKNQGH